MKEKYKSGYSSKKFAIFNMVPLSLTAHYGMRNNLDLKKESEKINAINLSILLLNNTMVEGFLEELIFEKILTYERIKSGNYHLPNFEFTEFDKIELRMIQQKLNQVDKNTWEKLLSDFKLVFGTKISDVINAEVWSAVRNQFVLRNMLSHGNTITFTQITGKERNLLNLQINKKYKEVFVHFDSKGLLSFSHDMNLRDLFRNAITDYFCNNSILFIRNLLDDLCKNHDYQYFKLKLDEFTELLKSQP